MKKITKIAIITLSLIFLSACGNNSPKKIVYTEDLSADKLEIVSFHSSFQCYACKYLGDQAKDIIDKNFEKELNEGRISFQRLSVEEAQNKEMVEKYQASGSSLFFNLTKDNEEKHYQDTAIWRFIGNDEKFEEYLINKINKILN